jgi:hypothetical protein
LARCIGDSPNVTTASLATIVRRELRATPSVACAPLFAWRLVDVLGLRLAFGGKQQAIVEPGSSVAMFMMSSAW